MSTLEPATDLAALRAENAKLKEALAWFVGKAREGREKRHAYRETLPEPEASELLPESWIHEWHGRITAAEKLLESA